MYYGGKEAQMHHYHTVRFGRSNSSLLSQIQATTVNMWPDGYYHQQNMFYFRNWTREMGKTFVDSLVEHARSGLFRPKSPNIHAVMSALYDVNKSMEPRLRMSGHNHGLKGSVSVTTCSVGLLTQMECSGTSV
ncbi:hypothetical protein Salat_2501900 [Sesamum alatum]|uniref:Uncharacterized protein n=1 Tax=Sesamum alatum TaxID=300844 RepID=A0AAE2CC62_9LAMI|nr:hypothetical protein Salat_2501900 [Sesamum alatum]